MMKASHFEVGGLKSIFLFVLKHLVFVLCDS